MLQSSDSNQNQMRPVIYSWPQTFHSWAQTKLGTAANYHMELKIAKSLTVFGNLME